MNDLTIEPRRCPVCERLVPGARCLLDDAITVPEGSFGADDPLLGTEVVEGFRVRERVASGRGGPVYEVLQEGTARRGWLRLLELSEAESYGVADRFAKVYASLFSKPPVGAPPVWRYGRTPGGRLYVVGAAPAGEPLEALLQRRWPLAPGRAVAIASRVVETLAAVHELGLVHGDVSPMRVWIQASEEDDQVSLTDAGLFEVLSTRGHAPAPAEGGDVSSDPRTMSPEVAAGYSADARSDLYSLGVLLGLLLTGVEPYEYAGRADLLRRHLREPYPANTLVGLPEDLKRIVLRLTEKSPAARFQSAAELRTALENTRDLMEMIGHDTDPDLAALASRGDPGGSRWGELVTIGDDADAGGRPPVAALASPSVLLRESLPATPRARGVHPVLLPVVAIALLFLAVVALVFSRFLTSVEGDRQSTAPGALATLSPSPAQGPAEPTPDKTPKVRATAAVVTSAGPVGPPAVDGGPKAAAEPPAAPAPEAAPPAVRPPAPTSSAVQLVDANTPVGQPISVELRSEPTGAFVMRDGFKIGQTPLTITLQSRRPFLVSLEKPGFVSHAVEVVPEQKTAYDVHLVVAPAPAVPPASVASPRPRPPRPEARPPAAARPGKAPPAGGAKKAEPASGYDLF